MYNFLIKLGKIKATFQQNGIKNASQKLWQDGKLFLRGYFNYKKSGEILLISGGVGDSARYRTFNVAEDLKQRGVKALAVNQSNFRLKRLIKNFSVIVFHHRVILDQRLKSIIKLAQKLKKKIIFDTDDLVLTQAQWKQTEYYQQANQWEKKQYQEGVGEYFLKNKIASGVTVSTDYLKKTIEQFYDLPCYVVKNKISQTEARWAEKILSEKNNSNNSFQDNSKIKLGYFSGTLSHNQDFATIIPVLDEILQNFPKLVLYLVGPLDVQNEFIQKFKKQIRQLPFVPRYQHYKNLSQIDVNLIPLRQGDPFCEAKSEIKFTEAGLVKVPSLATATGTFQKAIKDGENGFLASHSQEWKDKLTQLIENDSLRKSFGEKARQTVLKKYITGKGKFEMEKIYEK